MIQNLQRANENEGWECVILSSAMLFNFKELFSNFLRNTEEVKQSGKTKFLRKRKYIEKGAGGNSFLSKDYNFKLSLHCVLL